MNVQSSTHVQSTGYSPITSNPVAEPVKQGVEQPNQSEILQVRSGKQLQLAELKGVKLSVGEEQLIRAIDRAIKSLEGPETRFEMKVHDATNVVTIKVFNKETGELIREIPPEKSLDLVVKMKEIAGILVDEKV
ncbi:flagellar protein FlaG [Cohnella phaseoli]|uniref:Flagellar protein FlaG n=1 Tax=Cohnella phaseoli TaxID=456490 RepID=A0A3D9KBT3_9BACL|nr:flagellar protein FlaG [Cohnella phaseoli]RED83991.1 flagellar protein FlaG [Cohnella phaseoli]